jgi:hypothetical protein
VRYVRLLAVSLLAAVALVVTPAPAADSPAAAVQAHEAYERGTSAYRRGDYVAAAREYAAADALSPSPVALQAALDAAVRADDPVLGAALLDRARGAARTDGLVVTMLTAQKRFAGRTGRVRVACGGRPCLASIDGAAVDTSLPVIVRVGAHTVIVESAGVSATRPVTVGPDEVIEVPAPAAPGPALVAPPAVAGAAVAPTVVAPATAAAREPAMAPAPGLSPVWLAVGLGATAIAGGFAIASGVDTADQHATFESSCRGATIAPGCDQASRDGQSAQTRTDVLLAVTGGLAAATAVTAFFVRWHDVRVAAGPAAVTVAGLF